MTRGQASALLFGGAALSLVRSRGLTQTPVSLRVGVVPLESTAEVYYAKATGAFAKAGLNVDVQPFQNAGAIASAVAGGALDIGYATVPYVAFAHAKGLPFLFVAPASITNRNTPTTELIVRADSSIRSAKDLEGKIVAVPALSSANEYGARAWIDQNGGNSSNVKFVEVAFPVMVAGLEANRVDAASITEPFLTAAKKTSRVLANPNLAIAAEFINSGYVAAAQWANSQSDAVSHFATAIREMANWANSNPDKTVALLAQYTNLQPSVITTIVRARYAERATAALIQPVVDNTAKYGGFSSFPAGELIYSTHG